jgi:Leucine-rich repeat (LRR) protein
LMIAVVAVVGCSPTVEIANPIIEKAVREELKKPTGKLTKADLEKIDDLYIQNNQLTSVKGLEKLTLLTELYLDANKLTSVKGLEKLTHLTGLGLEDNQLTDLKGLEKLTQLTTLDLGGNPDLTKAQIDELQKALPDCTIDHTATK